DLPALELERRVEVGTHCDIPGAPHEVVEEHHQPQAEVGGKGHRVALWSPLTDFLPCMTIQAVVAVKKYSVLVMEGRDGQRRGPLHPVSAFLPGSILAPEGQKARTANSQGICERSGRSNSGAADFGHRGKGRISPLASVVASDASYSP